MVKTYTNIRDEFDKERFSEYTKDYRMIAEFLIIGKRPKDLDTKYFSR